MYGHGIIFFNLGEIPCPECLSEHPGQRVNPLFEMCQLPEHPRHEDMDCDKCNDEDCQQGELISCQFCNGTGRLPA